MPREIGVRERQLRAMREANAERSARETADLMKRLRQSVAEIPVGKRPRPAKKKRL